MSLFNACRIFSNLYNPLWVGKMFQFMVLTFLEYALNLGILLMPLLHTQNSRQNALEIFPTAAERGGENYGLLYQNSIRKFEDDLEH